MGEMRIPQNISVGKVDGKIVFGRYILKDNRKKDSKVTGYEGVSQIE